MALALLIINFLVGLIIVYVTVALVGPYYQIDLLTIMAFKNQAFGLVFFKILPLVITYVLLGALMAVFQTVAWTLLFEKLVAGEAYSKLIRLVSSLSNYMKVDNQVTKLSDLAKPRPVKIKRRPGRPKKNKKVKK
jgi:type III secretory pathway component EscS